VSRSDESGLNNVACNSGSPSLLLKQTSLSAQSRAVFPSVGLTVLVVCFVRILFNCLTYFCFQNCQNFIKNGCLYFLPRGVIWHLYYWYFLGSLNQTCASNWKSILHFDKVLINNQIIENVPLLCVCVCVCVCMYIYIYIYIYIQGVPGGKDLTSGECSLGQTITI